MSPSPLSLRKPGLPQLCVHHVLVPFLSLSLSLSQPGLFREEKFGYGAKRNKRNKKDSQLSFSPELPSGRRTIYLLHHHHCCCYCCCYCCYSTYVLRTLPRPVSGAFRPGYDLSLFPTQDSLATRARLLAVMSTEYDVLSTCS